MLNAQGTILHQVGILSASVIVMLILGCRRSSPEWTGTWKLDSSKSKSQGQEIGIELLQNGDYLYTSGTKTVTVRCDGKLWPAGTTRVEVCSKRDSNSLDLTQMENGVLTEKTHWELSSDNQTLTVSTTVVRSGRPSFTSKVEATRITGADGFVGRWRDLTFLQRHAGLTLKLDGKYLHIGSPDAGVDVPLDGTVAGPHGVNAKLDTTYKLERFDERHFVIHAMVRGKETRQEALTLTNNDRCITDAWSNEVVSTDRATLVYCRQ